MTGELTDDRVDAKGREILVTGFANEEDLVLCRHAVTAAHARAGALVVLDLERVEPWDGLDAVALLRHMARDVAGNGQRLAAIGRPAALGCDQGAVGEGVTFYPDLATCLRLEAPLEGKAHALHVTLPARVEYLSALRQHVSGIVKALHGGAEAFQTEILVDELALNAVENSPSSSSAYDFRFLVANHEMILEVTNDFDEAVDSARIMHRRLQSFDDSGRYLGERGRGLFLIARIADGLQIRAVEGERVRVTVTKRLRGLPES